MFFLAGGAAIAATQAWKLSRLGALREKVTRTQCFIIIIILSVSFHIPRRTDSVRHVFCNCRISSVGRAFDFIIIIIIIIIIIFGL